MNRLDSCKASSRTCIFSKSLNMVYVRLDMRTCLSTLSVYELVLALSSALCKIHLLYFGVNSVQMKNLIRFIVAKHQLKT